MSNGLPIPYFPNPPVVYDQRYMARVVQSFALFAQQTQVPGPFRATSLTLTTSPGNVDTGVLSYNQAEDTIDLLHLNGVTQQIGFETYLRAKNGTGATIPNGTVVGFAGVNSEVKVQPFIADGITPEIYLIGVTTFDMVDQAVGPVTVFGKVRGLNTTGTTVGETWVVGDVLYASPTTAGWFTKVRPTAPQGVIPVAAVLRVGAADGEILVRPTIQIGLNYGSFSSTVDQTVSAIDTATAVTLTTTENASGVSLGTPTSRIVVADAGYYQFSASIQLTSTNSRAKSVYFWLAKNGVAVPDSTRAVTIASSSAYFPASVTYDLSLRAGDYVEFMWAASDTAVTLDAIPASAFAPSAPSVLVSVAQLQL